ncbi:Zinc finger CCCH domain-containing protein 44 [Glycine max]|nr:Zinc finger CCCH domain-containing protein 44 [Glycine max]
MEPQLQPKLDPAPEVVSGGGGDSEKSHVSDVTEVRDVDMAQANGACCPSVLKRKRGRPAKGNRVPKGIIPPSRQKQEEEDVCFICFDGGSLVLCDRRGCPKAYHPSCIKRDEAFFRSKAKWNCGWHICSTCGKGSHYLCYTCTYSLCKGCTKKADFVSIRENKGLCGMCKKTIMLIENCAQGDKAACEVDFDDKSSWEYLFKVYWTYLKEKLSLTFDEILQAKNPYKGVARLEASGVAVDVSSLLLSPKMELPINNFVNDKPWHYQDPTGKVQGPFSLLQLYKWDAFGYFPPDLRIWSVDETQDNSIFLTDVLSGKCTNNVSLPNNSQQLSLGTNSTLENKDNGQDGGENENNLSRNENSANHQIVERCEEQKVSDTCTQSNGKDESVRSNGWNSQSPGLTIQADGNNNEGQSGNSERREESPKCEISCHDVPHVYASLPSTVFSEKLNENPSDKLTEVHKIEVKSEDNGNFDLNKISEGRSNSGQSCQKQSDSEENSGLSSGQNWRCPDVTNPVCNISTWLSIFGEPNDLDESVSDLLAEVEAMESLGGLESPTSIMKCGEELTDGSITDCLSFADALSPMLDAGKGDALSSSGDLHLPSQTTTPDDPLKQADVHHHPQKISGEHSTKSSEVEFLRLLSDDDDSHRLDNDLAFSEAVDAMALLSLIVKTHIRDLLEVIWMRFQLRKVTVLYELLSACLSDLGENNKKFSRRRKGYDAQQRVTLRLLATWLDIKWAKMEAIETIGASSAMVLLKSKRQVKKKFNQMKTRLAAPAIAAGLGALAPTLGTLIPVIGANEFAAAASAAGTVAGSVAVAASFGAAGAGLSGSKMARRVGDVDEFELKAVGKNHNQGRLGIMIMVSGFVFEDDDFIRPWEVLDDNLERYALQWESKNLFSLSTAIQDWLSSRIATELMKQGAKMTVLHALLTALAWPAALLAATEFIDSTWTIAIDRSDKAGKLLAEVLLGGLQGNRPVTLVGSIEFLAETENSAELVERVVLLGLPIAIKDENWEAARKMVAGRFVNAYSRNDWMLGVACFPCQVDVTDHIEGHSSYLWATEQVLDELELDTYYPVYNNIPKKHTVSLSSESGSPTISQR